ncbi:MAG: TIR domain-containing protein [Oceanospirillaceae bacterium]|nr:TIR domain-containing protein [Oceanospirillaceae bacterium]
MQSSIQKISGARALTTRLKKRAKTVERHYLGLNGHDDFIDWPKDAEIAAIEQVVRELSQEILGTDNIAPALWQEGRPFALEIQRPYTREARGPDRSNSEGQANYERAEAEYFRGFQLWCDHTDDFLEYLIGNQAAGSTASPSMQVPRNESNGLEFDVAISFAGEDRVTARKIAKLLRDNRRRVFYDEYEKASLWGQDLYSHLSNVYKNKARYCLILISKYYKDKLWTKHELQSAQARAFSEDQVYILPLYIDDTELEGILPTTGYLHVEQNSIEDIVEAIEQKLDDDT